ncbi:MAG: hypothetical protein C4547_14595 [Phycisphaerales bacterium]|nr:MAG: hypothetical protein C4547_14595 [Phycisphaerales bacterium]
MHAFEWRRHETRHFGPQWVPFVEVNLKAITGRWHTISMRVDTGAAVTLLPRAMGGALVGEPEAGAPIDLKSVAASPHGYYLHEVAAKIGSLPQFPLRVAVAERDDVPTLLGRLDVLDRFQIDFDASLEETRISLLWLDDKTRQKWRHVTDVEASIISKWAEFALPGRCDEAAKRFLNRADQLLAAGAGLLKLHRDFELPLVIRSLFDLSVQFEYLMQDPVPRAALYLDYEHITKHRSSQAWLRSPGVIGDRLRASPMRAQGEKRNRLEYDRVQHQFAVKPGSSRVRGHWYVGSLRSVAEEIGRTAEYESVYGLYSACAHGDSWTASQPGPAHAGLDHLYAYWSRIVICIADAKQIILPADQYELLVDLTKGGRMN